MYNIRYVIVRICLYGICYVCEVESVRDRVCVCQRVCMFKQARIQR